MRCDTPLPLGPYCCFSGAYLRGPTGRLVSVAAFAGTVTVLGVAAVFVAGALDPKPNFAAALTGAACTAVLVCYFLYEPWFRAWLAAGSAALAVLLLATNYAPVGPFPDTPVGVTDAVDWAWSAQLSGVRARDVVLIGLALLVAVEPVRTLRSAWRSAGLSERVWFAMFDPTTGRPLPSHRQRHGPVGVLAVFKDKLLAEKLIWLRVGNGATGVRVGGTEEPTVRLSDAAAQVCVFERDRKWHHTIGAIAGCRLLPILSVSADESPPEVAWQGVDDLPVCDFWETDNCYYAKQFDGNRHKLFGVLIHLPLDEPLPPLDPPPAVVLLEAPGSQVLHAEYPPAGIEISVGRTKSSLRLNWRGAGDRNATGATLPVTDGEPSVAVLRRGDGLRTAVLFLPAFGGQDE